MGDQEHPWRGNPTPGPSYDPPPPPPPPEKPQDCTPPKLEIVGGWPPELTGDVPESGDDDKDAPFPDGTPFTVTPSTIRDAESQILLNGVDPATDDYNTLRDFVTATKSWILKMPGDPQTGWYDSWQNNMETHHPNSYVPKPAEPPPSLGDAPDRLIANVDQALTACAAAITCCAEHVGLLNFAGQMYTYADKKSYFPGT